MKKVIGIISILFFLPLAQPITIEAYFSPQDKIHSKLVQAIDATQKKIYAAIYMFTDKSLVDALVKAKRERGVDVQIVTDKITLESSFGKAQMLIQQGITVYTFQPNENTYNHYFKSYPIMHHKFALFDKTVWTGSFNWTHSADTRNKENVVVIHNCPSLHRKYLQHFESLKKECKLSLPARSIQKTPADPLQLLKIFYRKIQQTERLLRSLQH